MSGAASERNADGGAEAARGLRRAVTRLSLRDFRNYAGLDLDLAPAPVLLSGPNGAGKTNILEAISCLAPGRGLRRAPVAELARRAAGDEAKGPPTGAWAVSADLRAGAETHRLGVGQDPAAPSRRIVRLDGETTTHAALGALMRVAWITPAQDRVFAGPRSERLRFYDRLTLALEPGHGAAATAYERALRERTRLLAENPDPTWLSAVEAQMAAHGARLAAARAALLARLQAAVDARPDTAFPKADLALAGALEAEAADGAPLEAVEAGFGARLAQARRRDAAAGRALEGPHRSDLEARHRAKGMPAADCSTGEQKALLIGLMLAHARALDDGAGAAAKTAGAPLLLLDEAAAHLDAARRAALAEEVCALDGQAWLTGTDAALFEAFGDRAQRVMVEDGGVTRG